MGNDGGSIPTRRELVKSPTAQQTHSQLRSAATQFSQYHWTYCPLSKRPLSSPIVSDPLGRLYNKDSIIEWLLRGFEAFGDGEEVLKGRHVKSLKDVVEVKFQVLEIEDNGNGGGEGGIGERKERWVCPITRKELGGAGTGVRAVYLVPCGCAFAEAAVKETMLAEKEKEGEAKMAECLQCGKACSPRDVININPTAEADLTRLQTRIKDLATQGLTHSLKKASGEKSKKRKNGETEEKNSGNEKHIDKKIEKGGSTNGVSSIIKNSATANLTNKVLADEREKAKVRKMEMSDNVKSLFTSSNKRGGKEKTKGRGNGDFMTRGYTLPKAG